MTAEDRRKKLADKKAFRKGEMFGIEFCLHVMAWVLIEVFHESGDKVQQMMDEMEDFCLDFAKGNVRYQDMVQVLHDEHGVTITFGERSKANG